MASDDSDDIVELEGAYRSCYGVPVIARVDTRVFTTHYFTHCLECTFCHDACCSYGVDVDLYHLERLKEHQQALEAYTGIPAHRWFRKHVTKEQEMPGGGSVRTRVAGGACVFLNRRSRGCLIHAFAIEHGLDYHELKPMVDCLFPISFYDDVLCPADEVCEDSLICLRTGPTLYDGQRGELRYYFGEQFVHELDAVARRV